MFMFNCLIFFLFLLNYNVFYLVIFVGYESDDNVEKYIICVFFFEFCYFYNLCELYKKRLMFKFILCFLIIKFIDF